MKISLIAALSENQVIGRDNSLPWRLPADLAYFKRRTMGHHLVMGRRTFESLVAPLPGRTMIVLTRKRNYRAKGTRVARSWDEALRFCPQGEEVFIAGGAEIYQLALPRADALYLTRVHARFEGDTYFPDVDWSLWQLTGREDHKADERNRYAYSFEVWERKHPPRGSSETAEAALRAPDESD